MHIKIELTTKQHTDWVDDKVTFEDDCDFIEINHHNGSTFSIRKTELRKVLHVLCEEE
ncbi:Uncharacterised protein [Niallia circulans]|uniref:hypothetical protein n=1 Tax=Niallia circulans TaxID=1397 RepID=UPI000A9D3250|nr:hypothetical protein [Niallia circulans]MED3839303.1 hypothetical protein [Niallia circulans]MED4245285.1 hypothetical protein [Niallia circulans]MED4250821.1 hypothetical protein [Niallia circulans]QKH60105.1 hypothetical protein FOC77_05275 [Niallia circulans]SPT82990.1 Uncharacterised protein [Niallia circulans]